jgi:hypothetical protein
MVLLREEEKENGPKKNQGIKPEEEVIQISL